ncbi:MFS general substrate transporter [Peniophora sp. CONT]|nr:MFS general substrate transporter [Peniophora sp. CONT]
MLPTTLDGSLPDSATPLREASVVHVEETEKIHDTSTVEAPDGGLAAWLQVVGSFFLIFSNWGIFNSFGAFQTYYEAQKLSSASAISWVGSVQGCILLFAGAITGPIFDMGYLHSLVTTGTVLIVLGMMMTSISTKYYEVFLAQGVCVGLGAGCLFIPGIAIVSAYFQKRRATAIGIAVSGSSLGGVVYSAIFRQLLDQIGFGWTTRVMGFIALATLVASLAIMPRRITIRTRRKLFEVEAWKEMPYTLFCIGNFLSFMGTFVPFFSLPAYASAHTSASPILAFYTLAILNASSAVGRIISSVFADKVGPLNMVIPCAFITSILAFCWISVDSVGSLVVFAVLYGVFSGSLLALARASVASLTKDIGRMGTRMGMASALGGIGLLIGNPVAGALVNTETGNYTRAQAFTGAIVMGAAIFMALARFAAVGPRWVKV